MSNANDKARTVLVWPDHIPDFEKDFIEHLCSNRYQGNYDAIEIVKDTPVDPNIRCIYVLNYWTSEHPMYGDLYHKPYGLLYLGDEGLSNRMDPYVADSKCIFIWRQYVHPKYFGNPKIFQMPCGYKNGFPMITTSKCEKDLLWSFAGARHVTRNVALDTLKNVSPHYVHETPPDSFNHADGLSTEDYRRLCERSMYVLCPTGHCSIECFRLYECLEAGSIPITITNSQQIQVLPSYHHAVFPPAADVGEIPFVIGQTWDDCRAFIENNRNPVEMTHKCNEYWKRCKQYWNVRLHKHAFLLF